MPISAMDAGLSAVPAPMVVAGYGRPGMPAPGPIAGVGGTPVWGMPISGHADWPARTSGIALRSPGQPDLVHDAEPHRKIICLSPSTTC